MNVQATTEKTIWTNLSGEFHKQSLTVLQALIFIESTEDMVVIRQFLSLDSSKESMGDYRWSIESYSGLLDELGRCDSSPLRYLGVGAGKNRKLCFPTSVHPDLSNADSELFNAVHYFQSRFAAMDPAVRSSIVITAKEDIREFLASAAKHP